MRYVTYVNANPLCQDGEDGAGAELDDSVGCGAEDGEVHGGSAGLSLRSG